MKPRGRDTGTDMVERFGGRVVGVTGGGSLRFVAAPALIAILLLCFAAAPAYAAEGKQVYEGKCQSCHGEDGTGRGSFLDLPDLTEESLWLGNTRNRLIDTVENGRGDMPGFRGMLNDEEIEASLRYGSREFGGVNWSEIREGEPVDTDGGTANAPGFVAVIAVLAAAALLPRRRPP